MKSAAVVPLALAAALMPRPEMTVSQWADEYRVVPSGTSPEPGRWRTDRVPYLREILDAISDPSVRRVVVCAASQVGKTELLLGAIGYYAHQEPSPILLVQATEDAMRSFSKERVAPMFEASPALRGLLDDSERSPSNTVMLRQFPGGMLACAWAGSAASLASRPIRVVLGDELDRWTDTTGRDGDPWAQAVQRTSNFFNAKVVAVSTPTIEGVSAIARLHEDTDRREFHVPCPRCGAYQVLLWKGIVYKREDGTRDLDDVHYKCEHCAGRIEERERPAMLAAGEWKPGPRGIDEDPAPTDARGFHISSLYRPWVRWRTLAEEWIRAHADRDQRGKQAFINLRLGEVWLEESERITVEALEKNREDYGEVEVPDGVLMLSCGVDTQDDRFELEVVGWGVGRESWGVQYEVIAGDTSLDATWQKLDAFLMKTWKRSDGRALPLWCIFIDSGGHRTSEVYGFAKARQQRNIYATKGYAGQGRPLVGKPTTTNMLRVNLFPIGADTGKEMVYSRLALTTPGPGYCHWPFRQGFDDHYFKGLVSERRVRKKRGGRTVIAWEQRGRNEPLDCRVLATAAMESMNLDFTALAEKEAKERGTGGGGAAPAQPAPRRRVISRGVQW